jgi:hypothetical protein
MHTVAPDDDKRRIDIEPNAPTDPVHAPGRTDRPRNRKPNPESEPDAGIQEPADGEGTPTDVDVPNEDQ